jgi:hypothetical protein
MAASRCGLRAPMRLRAVAMSRSASSGVRYSRGRRAALGRRRGGTFPFTVVGPLPCVTRFPSRLLGAGSRTFPFTAEDGKVEVGPLRGPPPDRSPDQELLRLTLLGYCVVLLVCLYVLWTFGRLDGKPLFPASSA